MMYSELASRYANAFFQLAKDEDLLEKVFNELRWINELITSDEVIEDFSHSPLIQPSEKVDTFKKALAGKGLTTISENFLLTLARKNRLGIFGEIVQAFQAKNDLANGVSRGAMISSTVLAPEERKELEITVEKVTGKKVVMTYSENPSFIGGLKATVGSFTFDDTLTGHLSRLQDDLKRSAH